MQINQYIFLGFTICIKFKFTSRGHRVSLLSSTILTPPSCSAVSTYVVKRNCGNIVNAGETNNVHHDTLFETEIPLEPEYLKWDIYKEEMQVLTVDRLECCRLRYVYILRSQIWESFTVQNPDDGRWSLNAVCWASVFGELNGPIVSWRLLATPERLTRWLQIPVNKKKTKVSQTTRSAPNCTTILQ